jgi:hypothetical protein
MKNRFQQQPGEASVGKPKVPSERGLLFLDFDDVICLNTPYGGYDLFQTTDDRPADLYQRLFHAPAVEVLLRVMNQATPRVVITTSWLNMMERAGFEALFRNTGLGLVADALHDAWEAPTLRGRSRLEAIENWLAEHHRGEPFVVLDDEFSGTGLRDSRLEGLGHVVLCQVNVGLGPSHLDQILKALTPA